MAKRPPKYLHFKGSIVEYEKANVHVLSTAMKYGAVVFEGPRADWNGARHREHLLEVIRANGFREDLHLRIQVFVEAPDGRLNSLEPVSISMAAVPMGDRSIPPRVSAIRDEYLATARAERNEELGWGTPVYAGAPTPAAG